VRRGGGVLALTALERTQRHGGSRQGAGRQACPPQGAGRVLRGSARAPTPRASYASHINRGCACRRSGPPQRARGYTRPCRRAADGGWARPHAHPRAEGRPHPPDGEARRAPARTALRVVRSASARTSQCRCGVHGGRTGRPTGRPRGVSRPNREKRMVGESALAPAAAGAATRPRLADRHGRGAPRVARLDPLSPKPMTAACVANPVGHKRAREGCGAPVGRARQVRRARAGLRLFGPAGVCRWVRPCAGEGPGAAAARGNHVRHGRACRGRSAPLARVGRLVGFFGPTASQGHRSGHRWTPGHAGHRLTTPQKNCVSRIVHAAPSQLPSTAAPVVARRVESVGQRVLVHSTERQATNNKKTRHETRWPAADTVFAVYAGSWQLRGNRAGGLSAVQYCPPATFCQLSECGGPQPHGDRRRARASQSQLSGDSETAVGNCLGLCMAPGVHTPASRLPVSASYALTDTVQGVLVVQDVQGY